MKKDVIDDAFGRLYNLPMRINEIEGVSVQAIALKYRSLVNSNGASGPDCIWKSQSYYPSQPFKLLSKTKELFSMIREYGPDVIISSSDVLNVALGGLIAKKMGTVHIVDLYDNYESFGMAKIIPLRLAFRHALKNADGVTCVSRELSEFITEKYRPKGMTAVIESTINRTEFFQTDMSAARESLSLPKDKILIGTAGSLGDAHGIDVLYRAFRKLKQVNQDIDLVLAGEPDQNNPIPSDNGIHHLGALDTQGVRLLFNSLDVAVICLRDTPFGRFAFPQKTYEILGCKRPLVAANVGAMAGLFRQYPDNLYQVDNAEDLAGKILRMIGNPVVPDLPVPTWEQQARKVYDLAREILDS